MTFHIACINFAKEINRIKTARKEIFIQTTVTYFTLSNDYSILLNEKKYNPFFSNIINAKV